MNGEALAGILFFILVCSGLGCVAIDFGDRPKNFWPIIITGAAMSMVVILAYVGLIYLEALGPCCVEEVYGVG